MTGLQTAAPRHKSSRTSSSRSRLIVGLIVGLASTSTSGSARFCVVLDLKKKDQCGEREKAYEEGVSGRNGKEGEKERILELHIDD